MKKIYLFCSTGMSTSLLVSKMKEIALEYNMPVEIHAFSDALINDKANDADIILLAPQIGFKLEEIKKRYSSKAIQVIDTKLYGKIDGLGVLQSAVQAYKSKKV